MNNKNFYIGGNHYNYDWVHLVAQYKKIVTKKAVVLEIGSSNPRKTQDLAKHCGKLIGLEKNSNQKLDTRTVIGDWINLKNIFPKQRFDIIVASHVIEHVEDDLSCLNQTFDVLKNGGYFIFTTPNRNRLFERLRSIFFGKRIFPFHEHTREYSITDINNLLSKSKFKHGKTEIRGIVFGLHASHLHIFLKNAPDIFKNWVNFWEVIIKT